MPEPPNPGSEAHWSDMRRDQRVQRDDNIGVHVEEPERMVVDSSDEEVEDDFDVTLRTPLKPEALRMDRMRSAASAMSASPVPTSATALTTDDDRMSARSSSTTDEDRMSVRAVSPASEAESDTGSVVGKAVPRRKRPLPQDQPTERTVATQPRSRASRSAAPGKALERNISRVRIVRPTKMVRNANSSRSETSDHPMDGSRPKAQTEAPDGPSDGVLRHEQPRKPGAEEPGGVSSIPQAAKRRRVNALDSKARPRSPVLVPPKAPAPVSTAVLNSRATNARPKTTAVKTSLAVERAKVKNATVRRPSGSSRTGGSGPSSASASAAGPNSSTHRVRGDVPSA